MGDQKFKLCLYCGEGDDESFSVFDNGERAFWVVCACCSAEGPVGGSTEEAIRKWNTRTPDPMLEELAEKVAYHYCNDELLKEMAGALMAADKFADDYHWAICSSLRGKIKQALQKYQQSKVQP